MLFHVEQLRERFHQVKRNIGDTREYLTQMLASDFLRRLVSVFFQCNKKQRDCSGSYTGYSRSLADCFRAYFIKLFQHFSRKPWNAVVNKALRDVFLLEPSEFIDLAQLSLDIAFILNLKLNLIDDLGVVDRIDFQCLHQIVIGRFLSSKDVCDRVG